jgi:hypothetical protein
MALQSNGATEREGPAQHMVDIEQERASERAANVCVLLIERKSERLSERQSSVCLVWCFVLALEARAAARPAEQPSALRGCTRTALVRWTSPEA